MLTNRNNELPEAFKMSAVGPLPQEWEAVKLVNYLEERKVKNKANQRLAVYTISNVYGFILSDDFFDKQVYSRELKTYKIVSKGDFAYNPYRVNVGSLGLFLRNEMGLVSPAYVVFRIKGSELDNHYLYELLKSDAYIEQIRKFSMSRGSVRRSLSYRDLAQFTIRLPPLPEQRAIARVLSTIQRAVEAQDKIITAMRELKKSLMRHLFTYGPVPVSEAEQVTLKETEIGQIPEHWEVVRLGEVMMEEIRNGAFIRRNRFGDGVAFLNVADTYNHLSVDFRFLERVQITNSEFKLYEIKPNDLFYVRSSLKREGVGQCCIAEYVPEPAIYDCHLMRVRVDDSIVVPKYLAYFSVSILGKQSLISRSKTTTMTTINQQGLASFILPLPPCHIQQEIANILTAVDKKIETDEKRKVALQALFKTTLHLLMTGKVRVKELEARVS